MSPPVGTTVPASPPGEAPVHSRVHLLYRDGAGDLHLDLPLSQIEAALGDPTGLLWVDFEAVEDPGIAEVQHWLCDVFHFHPLAVEDALQETHLPKVDDWGAYLYLVFDVLRINPDSGNLEFQELDVFLGSNFLVTYHTAPLEILDRKRASVQRDPREQMRHGADHLLFRLLELAVDQSLEVIEHLDERVDQIQNKVIENPRPEIVRTIFRIKRSAIRLHKSLGPQREVLNRLARDSYPPVRAENRVYFRDLYDHVVRIHDISESLRDLIAGTLETYLSVISNRTNEIMKVLTMVSVMFLPMSFLAGFFGMNFFGESLALKTPMARGLLFLLTCTIMAISPCAMWVYARRRKWF